MQLGSGRLLEAIEVWGKDRRANLEEARELRDDGRTILAQAYRDGVSVAEMAHLAEVTPTDIYRLLRQAGIAREPA